MKRVFFIFGYIYQYQTDMIDDNEYKHLGSLSLTASKKLPQEKFVEKIIDHLQELIKKNILQKELIKNTSGKNYGEVTTFTYHFKHLPREASKKLIASLEKQLKTRLSEVFEM